MSTYPPSGTSTGTSGVSGTRGVSTGPSTPTTPTTTTTGTTTGPTYSGGAGGLAGGPGAGTRPSGTALGESEVVGVGSMRRRPHLTTILVTGATGTIGKKVIVEMEKMRKKGLYAYNLAVGTHGTERRPTDQEYLRQFDRIIRLDAEDIGTLDFRGVDALCVIAPNKENRVNMVRNYVTAARDAGVKYILLVSVLGCEDRGDMFSQHFRDMEVEIENSGIACTFLRVNFLMENLRKQADLIQRESVIRLPIVNGRWAPISAEDVAKAVAAMLRRPEPHMNKAYDLTGPELLSGADIARCASRGLNRDIRFESCSADEYVELVGRHGVPTWLGRSMADFLSRFGTTSRFADIDSRDFFFDLTGERQMTLTQWFQLHSQEFPQVGKPAMPAAAPTREAAPVPVPAMALVAPWGGGGGMVGPLGPADAQLMIDVLNEMINDRLRFTRSQRQIMIENEDRLRHLYDLRGTLSGALSKFRVGQVPLYQRTEAPELGGRAGIGEEVGGAGRTGAGYETGVGTTTTGYGPSTGVGGVGGGYERGGYAGAKEPGREEWGRPGYGAAKEPGREEWSKPTTTTGTTTTVGGGDVYGRGIGEKQQQQQYQPMQQQAQTQTSAGVPVGGR
ncbi:hypothetical protein HK102_006046 [Quaeritorhiza haematococci]|nr:hypothetical protein HK102_006046 [Quaeritorhiza haematococci]